MIGADGDIPWRLSSDLKHFKALTLGHTMVMGRRTYQSIGRPLPVRRTIVVTSKPLQGLETAASLGDALAQAGRPVFLVGGAAIYSEGMAHADTIYLTRVHASPPGDTFFPEIDDQIFSCISRETGEPGPADGCAFTFLVYRRRAGGD